MRHATDPASVTLMLDVLTRVQKGFLDPLSTNREAFDQLLDGLLQTTGSEFGFIGEIREDEAGRRHLVTFAITDIAWNAETRKHYGDHVETGMVFDNLDTLFGRVIRTGEVLIANAAASHAASGGLPPGHPPLHSFLGLPILFGGRMIGMAGIANRPGGYDQAIVDFLEPLLVTAGNLVHARALETERAGVRARMERAELLQKAAADAAQLGIWQCEVATGRSVWDHRAGAILDVDAPELALSWEAFERGLHPDDAEHVLETTRRHMADPSMRYQLDGRVLTGKKEYKWVRVFGRVAELDAEGRPRLLCGTIQDISDEKALEAALRESRDRAEQASEAKSRFLANMSHEIRTPLNGVLGMAQLLGRTPLDARQQRYLNTLMSSGDALLEQIEDVLDYSKIEADRLELECAAFDLRAALLQAADAVRGVAEAKGLAFAVDIERAGAPRVRGDARRLRQVLINLLGNAAKFTEEGAISLHAEALGAGRYAFEVTDTGPGVPEALQPVIFERFMQADSQPSRRHGGSGLGLAIARALARLMDGDISLRSREGEGAVFRVEVCLPDA